MQNAISAKGYASVVLVLDMERFVAPEQQEQFAGLRGTKALTHVLQDVWPQTLSEQKAFVSVAPPANIERMNTDEVGFLTGVFRQTMLENYSTPCYKLRKGQVQFLELPTDNLQFKKLFMDAWQRWDITIRPTMTGMFIVKLQRPYPKPTPLIRIASDIVGLQVSFDVPGALQWLEKIEELFADDEEALRQKRKSVQKFLTWLGSQRNGTSSLGYAPVQWQIAMEVCRQFTKAVHLTLPATGQSVIKLAIPEVSISTPLHDSYVMYHLDELFAPPYILNNKKGKAAKAAGQTDILVTPGYLQSSQAVRQSLVQLIESAILRAPRTDGSDNELSRRFPKHRATYVEDIFKHDRATWIDELCLLTPRATIIMPSRYFNQHELFISTLPTTTSQVMYTWYWEAMERLLEFVIEVRVLAQLVERASARALQNFVTTSRETRVSMVEDDIQLDHRRIISLSKEAANLSRLVSVCQTLSNPQVWSRAEYAVDKAAYLFEQLGVPLLLSHAERNVSNMTNLLNHVDELYMALISKRSSQLTFWLSAGLASMSLIVILYSLPSFWADLAELDPGIISQTIKFNFLPIIIQLGNILAPVVAIVSFSIIAVAIWRTIRAWRAQTRA